MDILLTIASSSVAVSEEVEILKLLASFRICIIIETTPKERPKEIIK